MTLFIYPVYKVSCDLKASKDTFRCKPDLLTFSKSVLQPLFTHIVQHISLISPSVYISKQVFLNYVPFQSPLCARLIYLLQAIFSNDVKWIIKPQVLSAKVISKSTEKCDFFGDDRTFESKGLVGPDDRPPMASKIPVFAELRNFFSSRKLN